MEWIDLALSLHPFAPYPWNLFQRTQAGSFRHCYLGVYDIPASGTGNYRAVSETSQLSDIPAALERIEKQEQIPDSIRVYIDEIGVNKDLQTRLSAHWRHSLGIKHSDNEYGTGFYAAMSLCKSGYNQNRWYVVEGIEYDKSRGFSTSSGDLWESFSEERPIKALMEDFREIFQVKLPIWVSVMRRVRFQETTRGQFTVLISCKTINPQMYGKLNGQPHDQESSPSASTAKFVLELLRQLEPIYSPMRSVENWKQIFLLQYQHANLNLFVQSLQRFANEYTPRRRRDFDPRSSKLRRWVLREMAIDASYYRTLTNIGNDLADTLESLVQVVKESPDLQHSELETMVTFSQIEVEIRGCCKDVRNHLGRLNDDMDNNLKFLDLARNMDQTRNVELLTILATVFLPLSLSAGILSMQSRLKDLGALLYDFVGVIVLLVAFATFVVVSLIVFDLMQEHATKVFKAKIFKQIWRGVLFYLALATMTIGLLVLTSFTVGMFKDITLGWLILGYGLAAAVGGSFVLGILYSFSMTFLEYFLDKLRETGHAITEFLKSTGGKNRQADTEGGLVSDNHTETEQRPDLENDKGKEAEK